MRRRKRQAAQGPLACFKDVEYIISCATGLLLSCKDASPKRHSIFLRSTQRRLIFCWMFHFQLSALQRRGIVSTILSVQRLRPRSAFQTGVRRANTLSRKRRAAHALRISSCHRTPLLPNISLSILPIFSPELHKKFRCSSKGCILLHTSLTGTNQSCLPMKPLKQ